MVASTSRPATSRSLVLPSLDAIGAWVLALVWIAPLVFAVWAAFHTPRAALAFDISAPLTFANFVAAYNLAKRLKTLNGHTPTSSSARLDEGTPTVHFKSAPSNSGTQASSVGARPF